MRILLIIRKKFNQNKYASEPRKWNALFLLFSLTFYEHYNLLFYSLAHKYKMFIAKIYSVCLCVCVCASWVLHGTCQGRKGYWVECTPPGSLAMVYIPRGPSQGQQSQFSNSLGGAALTCSVSARSHSCSFLCACSGDLSSQFACSSSAFSTECLEYWEKPQSWAKRRVGHPVPVPLGTVIIYSQSLFEPQRWHPYRWQLFVTTWCNRRRQRWSKLHWHWLQG